jgi:hypothetical protein
MAVRSGLGRSDLSVPGLAVPRALGVLGGCQPDYKELMTGCREEKPAVHGELGLLDYLAR